jgi:hypothetical protein
VKIVAKDTLMSQKPWDNNDAMFHLSLFLHSLVLNRMN